MKAKLNNQAHNDIQVSHVIDIFVVFKRISKKKLRQIAGAESSQLQHCAPLTTDYYSLFTKTNKKSQLNFSVLQSFMK